MSVSVDVASIEDQLERLFDRVASVAIEVVEPGAVAALGAEATQLAARANADGLRGVPELLRLLGAGLLQWVGPRRGLEENDLVTLGMWVTGVQNYCRGELPKAANASLIDGLESLVWVPDISPRLREFILARLDDRVHVHPPAPDRMPRLPVDVTSDAQALGSMLSSTLIQTEAVENADDAREAENINAIAGIDNKSLLLVQQISTIPQDSEEQASSSSNEPLFQSEPHDPWVSASAGESDFGRMAVIEELSAGAFGAELPAIDFTPQPANVFATETMSGDTTAQIWISPEELELAALAIGEQLMPLAEALLAGAETDQRAALLEDYRYHAGLICNALEMLGLLQFNRCGHVVLNELERLPQLPEGAFAEQLGLLSRWQVALFGFLQAAQDPAAAELLIETLLDGGWATELDADMAVALATELTRIRIGQDPKLKQARKQTAQPEDVLLTVAADVLPAVLDGMRRELPGNAALLALRLHKFARAGAAEDIDVARRVAHTLKGDANTVGIRGIANLTHALEDILGHLAKNPSIPEPALAGTLQEAADCVEAMADHVLGRAPAPDDAVDVLQKVMVWANALNDGEVPAVLVSATPIVNTTSAAIVEPRVAPPQSRAELPAARDDGGTAVLQIPVAVLDNLLRLSSETIVMARQLEEQVRGIAGAHGELLQQGGHTRELVSQLDEMVALRGAALQSARLEDGHEIDALELDQYNELHIVSRSLIETSSDTNAHLQGIDRSLAFLRDLAAQQDRVHQEMQRSILITRSVPVSHQVPRFQRVVRQTARALLKDVELDVLGSEIAVDSDILDRMTDPLVHALRNAVDHGIETVEERARSGKPTQGRIALEIQRRGADILFRLTDDGRGLDFDAIRDKGEELGLLRPDQRTSDDELARMILLPGFSTRDETTQMSGRGIGMDVVHRRVGELRGSMSIQSTRGLGTCLEIVLPASLVSAHVALAKTHSGIAAVVTNGIVRFIPISNTSLERAADGLWLSVDGERVEALPLDALMGESGSTDGDAELPLGLLVQDETGVRHVILTRGVDEMRSVIVKSFGPYVAPIPGVRGATILGTGALAPVLDLARLVSDLGRHQIDQTLLASAPRARLPRVVVADDSLSVRRALEQLMQDAGFEVVSARDGLEALGLINQAPPVAVLVDLEMPRMNGLELTTHLRNASATARVPIIMITSRTSDRHRQLAESAGVTRLLGKPYSDDELVGYIRQAIATASAGQPEGISR